MKIAVIGATGLIGSRVTRILERNGIEVIKASTSTGVDAYTGSGLQEALDGADVVIDVTNTGSFGETDALGFFKQTGTNLLAAARGLGVKHYLVLSVVGTEHMVENDYFRAKLVQENMVRCSGLPFTIIRSTQFFEFFHAIVNDSAVDGTLRFPAIFLQPIAAEEAAGLIADIATQKPRNTTVEIGGPERVPLVELAGELVTACEDGRPVIADPASQYFGVSLPSEGLLSARMAASGTLNFHDWLSQNMSAQDVV